MSALKNKFVGYTERSAEQQKPAILAKINTPDGIPEMTDHTDSNPWVRTLDIWTGISEQFNYYIDGAAQESYPSVAEEYKSLALIAKTFDYRIKGAVGSRVGVTFTLDALAPEDVPIPAGTRVETVDGLVFYTIALGTILTGNNGATIQCRQEVPVGPVVFGPTTGQANQKIPLGANVVDNSLNISIQAVAWFGQETFAFSAGTDLHFVGGMNEDGLMQIEFGDNFNGKIPTGAQDVNTTYRITQGSAGNVPANVITQIISVIAVPGGLNISCTNPFPATGGTDAEGLDILKKRIPLSMRTLYRAVTEDDYKSIAEMAAGVAKAGVFYVCGKVIDIYITPEGDLNGIASQQLLDDTKAYIDKRKMVTTLVNVKAAGVVRTIMEFDVFLLPNYFNAEKEAEGIARITEFLNITRQEIYGKVQIGDLYELLETMEGVDYSKMKKLSTVPYARPINHERQLFWTREVKPGSVATVHWKVVKTDAFVYQLLKNGAFQGTFNWDTQYSQFPEITFSISERVEDFAGATWEFVTYKYNDSITLDEPSVPVSDDVDVVLNVTGGIV